MVIIMERTFEDIALEDSPQKDLAEEKSFQTFQEEDIKENEADITYKTIKVDTFSGAIQDILSSKDENSVCMVDVDGTLIENKLTQYPGICHLIDHNVAQEVQVSLKSLILGLGQDGVCIVTNRDENVKVVWSSKRIVNTVQEVLERMNFANVKIFTGLNKQIPNIAKRKRSALVEHYVNYIEESDIKGRLKLSTIEDDHFITLDRTVFPKEIASEIQKRVKERLRRDIGIDIIDCKLKC